MYTEITSYQAALDYLYSFIDREKSPPTSQQAAQYNLARTRALLAAVGQPQSRFASIVVAGTKGKGSTSAILESILRTAGYRTGLWTSPHLHSYRERIQVDRELITQEELVIAMQQMVPVLTDFDVAQYERPSTFEIGFALALRYFAEQRIELAVIEVGMGGRYDAANTLIPLVSLVSSISLDHTRQLGNTLAAIARQKAGIFKAGVDAIIVPQHPEAQAMLVQVANEVGTPLWVASAQGLVPPDGADERESEAYPVAPIPALRGDFQHENAQLAVAAALRLRRQGLTLPDAAVAQGLQTVNWPGRLEVVEQSPLMVLDGAHNGYSAERLAAALRVEFRYRRLILVLGMSHDKPLEPILQALVPETSVLILTRSHHPRAYSDLDKLAAAAQPWLRGTVLLTTEIPAALAVAREQAGSEDLICVTGSLFVVGTAREVLGLGVSD